MFDPKWLCPEIRSEFERWMSEVPDDPYGGTNTLGIHSVLRAHFLIANYFFLEGAGIGGVGPKDINLLHSALYRQHVSIRGVPKWTDRFDLCATLMFGLIKDHPFYDANKRTAFLSSMYQLHNMGRTPDIALLEFENFTVDIADNKLGKYSRYKNLVRNNDSDAEVKFISHYLRTNTRELDRRFYTVTFRELRRLLNRFECDIDNPQGNYIDVFKTFQMRAGLFGRRIVKERRRVAQIGFPGWGKQVHQGAMRTVRAACLLTPAHGIDSQVFYREVDDLETLIAYYQEPLSRLAER
jgi:death-on-curing family protein